MAEEGEMNDNIPAGDIMEILIATDIHLGYNEKDPVRGDDSFNSFEEILKIAREKQVDFILLGGDLFHDNKPSMSCYHRCLKLMRQYCLGDKPIRVEFLSDQSENFKHCDYPLVNYEDPNFSVSIPVFSIHGNHDDPSGHGQLSSMDILSVSGLVNYFGKWTDLKSVEVNPLLFRKGCTNVAIYGLSYIKDDRLARLFRDKCVKFYQPNENTNSWFNIFVCHQNRSDRGLNKYIPEEAIPNFMDFVVWGHEHDCRITPEYNPKQDFYVCQPGSPVATSLSEGEARPKHVGLLQVWKQKRKFVAIPLRTVRPFVFDSVTLSEHNFEPDGESMVECVERFLIDKIDKLILESQKQVSGYEKQPTLPLIRLKVEWSDESHCINAVRFGNMYFQDKVANPFQMILMRKEKLDKKKNEKVIDENILENILEDEPESVKNVLERYFTEVDPSKQLKVLSVAGLGEAVSRFVDRGDKEAINDLSKHQVNKTIDFLKTRDINEKTILEEVEEYRLIRLEKAKDEIQEANEVLASNTRSQSRLADDDDVILNSDNENGNDSDEFPAAKAASSSTTRGKRGRGAGTRARGRARGAVATGRGAKQSLLDSSVTTTKRTTSRAKPQKKYVDLSDSD